MFPTSSFFFKITEQSTDWRAQSKKKVGWFNCITGVDTNRTVGANGSNLESCGKQATGSTHDNKKNSDDKSTKKDTKKFANR